MMMSSSGGASGGPDDSLEQSFAIRVWASFARQGNAYVNRSILYLKSRWAVFFLLLTAYVLRVWRVGGFFVVTYALGIYLLNILIGFLSPRNDPETEEYVLPTRESDLGRQEFRPFLRQMPEFKCWISGCRALLICIAMTFFPIFDMPVFWPILFFYFLVLVFLTLKQQIQRMIKYKYLPFSWGKQTYGDITRNNFVQEREPAVAMGAAPAAGSSAQTDGVGSNFMSSYILK